MIQDMRTLALDYLMTKLVPESCEDPEEWYSTIRHNDGSQLFHYMVESSDRIGSVYILQDVEPGLVELKSVDNGSLDCPPDSLPFVKPPGSQSPAVGPILKRSYSKDKGAGPSDKILKTTINLFHQIANQDKPWSGYFTEILSILSVERIKTGDGRILDWTTHYPNLLACARDLIGPKNEPVFLTVRSRNGRLPGQQLVYMQYLFEEVLASGRYVTEETPAHAKGTCAICQASSVATYSNGLKGAGLNILNADRAGAFPNINPEQAWKRFAICAACADLLFVFKNHILKKDAQGKMLFRERVAGTAALILPSFFPTISAADRRNLMRDILMYLKDFTTQIDETEKSLLDQMMTIEGIMSFTILWAEVRQNLENITGIITQVLPSRLRMLSDVNHEAQTWRHALYPQEPSELDLRMGILSALFYRPGPYGSRDNKSESVRQLIRQVADAIYHRQSLPQERWNQEFLITARAYWADALEREKGFWGLLNVFQGKQPGIMSPALWIRRINWLHRYFENPEVGVLTMSTDYFVPKLEALRPYFGPQSGIDTPEKAYGFLLGVLYGKVIQIQGARGVNVAANALSWLKRLTLNGQDLPELYIKVREKLLAYEAEGNPAIRGVLQEFGRLAVQLGDSIQLSNVHTVYYLLLGQSMTASVLPSSTKPLQGGEE